MDHDGLAALAESQFSLLTRAQVRDAGVSDAFIAWRLASDRWRQIHPGVYLTSPGGDGWEMQAMAAVLVCGRGAVLSHRSAGHTFGLVKVAPEIIDVLVPHGRTVSRREGITVRRSRHLSDRTAADGDRPMVLPRTTVEHTVLDLAADGSGDEAIALVASACQKGLTWDEALMAALSSRAPQRWSTLLREALGDVGLGAQSVLEVRYLRDVERAHGLPGGRPQHPTQGGRRRHDIGYPDQRVLVELDGLEFHSAPEARIRDGRRDRGGLVAGWVTVRAFWTDVAVTPCELAVDVSGLLIERGWTGAPRRCRRQGCSVH